MQVTPTELVDGQKELTVKFTPINQQKVFLDRYRLTIKVEDRAGVLNWTSKLRDSHQSPIKIKNTTLNSLSRSLTELDPADPHANNMKIKLSIDPDLGSRKIVIKFELRDIHNRLLQKTAATWRKKMGDLPPNPDDSIDPNAVIKRKFGLTPDKEKIAEEILRREREQEEAEEEKKRKEAEEKQKEDEIRKKRGEEWLGGEGKKWGKYWERE